MQADNWQRFCRYLFYSEELGLELDISKIHFADDYLPGMENRMKIVYAQIDKLEQGEIFNPDENRMVGHYWLRCPQLAPRPEITREINSTIAAVKHFASQIHNGILRGQNGRSFGNVLLIGIGGSSLGPKFLAQALSQPGDKLKTFFLDNTDPDGMDMVFEELKDQLDRTLTIVISKSGGTIETRNAMEEVRYLYRQKGLDFSKHAVSITRAGSALDKTSRQEQWLAAFPMWDWVGGRTSVLSAVGLLPLALQGVNIDLLLQGARKCDEITRRPLTLKNPSALLALMWYAVTGGKGGKEMVILPYKDRLQLLTPYLQQLIMESLGKETDLEGKVVRHGITVYGNKGSTDQHSYLQQLLDGPDNFFVTFIEVLKDRQDSSLRIADNSTSGDYLQAFLLGTRKALTLKGRQSITITIPEINEFALGVLLALFERAVSMYALLVNINAYHQPAVELGKKQAGEIIALKNKAVGVLWAHKGQKYNVETLASELGPETDKETLYKILRHLSHNPQNRISAEIENPEATDVSLASIYYQAH